MAVSTKGSYGHKVVGIVFFVSMILISHYILPSFNSSKDWFLFTPWNMFTSIERATTLDISCDEGKTFVFRDMQTALNSAGVRTRALFYFINRSSLLEDLKASRTSELIDQLKILNRVCENRQIQIFEINLSLFDHIILKRNPSERKEIFKL
jgi:hypothetical protein